MTKSTEMQLVRNMAIEFASRGMAANSITSGTFKTGMARFKWEDPVTIEWYNGRNPSKRFVGGTDEIAELAMMLASPSGGYINGHTIALDGGHSISFR